MTFPVLSASTPSTGYNLTRSLRFRSSASAYLSRTPASASNRTTWTWSGWVKRGAISSATMGIFGVDGSTSYMFITFNNSGSNNELDCGELATTQQWRRVTTQVFRDPSAWYHIVFAFDSTQATAGNRIKIYVNGTQVTSFSTSVDPPLNYSSIVNTATAHSIGRVALPTGYYLDGYFTEVNFIDGQQLTPSSFGSTNATTGVWQPAKYTGTYGTNGFYLPFTDNSALTTASNAGLGKDFSGNANYWVTNNISITAGSTYDSMTDVPTLTSATAANYATWNGVAIGTDATLSGGNLNISYGSATPFLGTSATIGMQSGKWYWEITITASSASPANVLLGISTKSSPNEIGSYPGANANGWGYYGVTGEKYNNATGSAYGATYTTNDVIGVAFDATAGTLVFYKNNTSQGTAFSGLTSGPYFPVIGDGSGGATFSASTNFGQRPFTYTPPSGFVALNTYNIAASTVPNGAAFMAATLYTGTLLSNTIANTVGSASFQPDLVWIKSRSAATDNKLTDSVRGVTKGLVSNTSAAETTDTQGLTAFGSTGFTVGTNTDYNNLSATYVAWQWNAGGSTVTNTNGSISSQVRANTTAGFSVVTFTGAGSAATVGHGLNVAPSMMIVKLSSAVSEWFVYTSTTGASNKLNLHLTSASTASGVWNNTAPTSSLFSVNGLTGSAVAYCFTPIKGFSAFGSYTGNGSTDGPFVYTGFRPRWLMIKNSTTAGTAWLLLDTSRAPANVIGNALAAESSAAEGSGSTWADTLSNGFKIRNTSSSSNTSSDTYIYACFAENPFQNALAR